MGRGEGRGRAQSSFGVTVLCQMVTYKTVKRPRKTSHSRNNVEGPVPQHELGAGRTKPKPVKSWPNRKITFKFKYIYMHYLAAAGGSFLQRC